MTADPATVTAASQAINEYVSVYTPLAVIHINDHHSHLEPNDGAELTFDGETIGVETGGFARVVTQMRDLAAAHPKSLLLHAGDAITGTIYSTSFKGQADAELMNQVCSGGHHRSPVCRDPEKAQPSPRRPSGSCHRWDRRRISAPLDVEATFGSIWSNNSMPLRSNESAAGAG